MCGFLFEDAIFVLMKVVYLIIGVNLSKILGGEWSGQSAMTVDIIGVSSAA